MLIAVGSGVAQEKGGWELNANVQSGMLLYHHSNMRALAERNTTGVEVGAVWRMQSNESWLSFYGYPSYGVSFALWDLGSPTYLGNMYALYPSMTFYLLSRSTVGIDMTVGAGAAYVEKTYHHKYNYKNIAIGSHLNAFLRLNLAAKLKLSDRLSLNAGFSFSHLSNGTFKKPNAGLNMVSFSLGGAYAFAAKPLRSRPAFENEEEPVRTAKEWSYYLFLGGGVKETWPIESGKHLATGLSFEASRTHLAFTRFSGAFDVFYDASDYVTLRDEGCDVNRIQTVKLGVAAGYEFQFGRLSANLQAGIYLYAKNTENGILYQRMSLRYQLANRFKVHFGLKNHLGKADYIELGCGVKLNR